MTQRTHRLALLASLIGVGLAAPGGVRSDDGTPRDDARDVERVMRVLGLDTGPSRAVDPPRAAPAVPVFLAEAMRPPVPREPAKPRIDVAHAVARPVIEPIPVPLQASDESDQHVPDAVADEAQTVADVDTDAAADPAPVPAPQEPLPPVEPRQTLGLAASARPSDTPEDPPRTTALVPDALLPPEPPVARVSRAAVSTGVDDVDDLELFVLALVPADDPDTPEEAAPASPSVLMAAPTQADRVMATLAGVRAGDDTPAGPPVAAVDIELDLEHVEPPHVERRRAYLQSRLAARAQVAHATTTARVLGDLAALVGADALQAELGVVEPAGPADRVRADLARVRRAPPWQGETVAMDEDRLSSTRAGFVTNVGLQVSFGIERAVYINGNLVTTTSLNVTDLGRATAGATINGSLALIQSGVGNTFQPGTVSSSALGTVIQNTLDNQKIQNLTVVSATVNSMEVLKSMNLQMAVRRAIIDSIRR